MNELPSVSPKRSSAFSRAAATGFLEGLRRFSGIYLAIVLIILFSVLSPDVFATTTTVRIVANEQALIVILALAALIPIVAGVYDLSVAQILGFSGLLVGLLMRSGMNVILAIVLTLAAGAFIGLVNALVVVRFKVNSFIGTLAMTSLLAGFGSLIANNEDITTGFSPKLLSVGQWTLPHIGFRSDVLFMLALVLVMFIFFHFTPLGRSLYAVGDNAEAARLAGIRVNRFVTGSFVASGVMASLAGVLYVAQVSNAQQSAGPPYLLPVFSGLYLGATQIFPGKFNVLGTLVAIYVLAIGVKGLQLTVSAPWIDNVFTGGALIIAVALAQRDRSRWN
jgi:ribose transport system permease protein